MITEQDLKEAIAECQGVRNPDAHTCMKLAAYYTILNNIGNDAPKYSYASTPTQENEIPYSESEFSKLVMKKGIENVFSIFDELMDTLTVVNPKLHQSVLRRISDI